MYHVPVVERITMVQGYSTVWLYDGYYLVAQLHPTGAFTLKEHAYGAFTSGCL